MHGQWIGRFSGTNEGLAVLELDDRGDHFEGQVYAYDDRPQLPGVMGFVRTPRKTLPFELGINFIVLDPASGDPTTWDAIKQHFPNATPASRAESVWKGDGARLTVEWKTDIGTQGTAQLESSRAGQPSEIEAIGPLNWEQYLEHVRKLPHSGFIFRGQEDSKWRLRTYFHRTRRADLVRFMSEDIPKLHKQLSGLTAHPFNLTNPLENGAFYALLQHHGYPTPLLDWTQSPFIAAYFAFRRVSTDRQASAENVRILLFDAQNWSWDLRQLQKLAPARPHVSMLDALAIGNSRVIPQQALSTVSNVDDMESYIRSKESEHKRYLMAVDIPISERKRAMQDLMMMGITAGSMFPGLDGACEQMKERLFSQY